MRTLILTAALTGSLAIPAVAISDPAPPPGQLQTTDQTTKSTVQDAAAAPMHDLNVVRAKIPPVLLGATRAWETALGQGIDDGWKWVELLVVFAVVYVTAGVFGFGPLLEEA